MLQKKFYKNMSKYVSEFTTIWDIEVSIGLQFLPSIRDEFRYMWE